MVEGVTQLHKEITWLVVVWMSIEYGCGTARGHVYVYE